MNASRIAIRDDLLAAVVISSRSLNYSDGSDLAQDRPSHVRAGSSLALVPGGIAVIQDDANFVAVFDPSGDRVRAIPLPSGQSGVRQFDDSRGNKDDKPDFEACVTAQGENGLTLIAFGSGANAQRETIALINGWNDAEQRATLIHAPHFYDMLRKEEKFSGSQLNVEGAILSGDNLVLFGRGNGAPRAEVLPCNATCNIELALLQNYLRDPLHRASPRPTGIVRYELGALAGQGLTFTDATGCGDLILYTATAEDSPDVILDGHVSGSAIGVIDREGHTRWAPLTDESGSAFAAKVEGLVIATDSRDKLFVVVDSDKHDNASILCTVELRGDWLQGS